MCRLLSKTRRSVLLSICLFQTFVWYQVHNLSNRFSSIENLLTKQTLPTSSPNSLIREKLENNATVILMWTKYYSDSDEFLLNSIQFGKTWRSGCCSEPVCCSESDILVTGDKTLLPRATAVVFYNYYDNIYVTELPTTRYPGQLWILFAKENPTYSPELKQYANLFNWTMSYRLDSDIWAPYGYKVPLDKPLSKNYTIIMPGKIPLNQWIAEKSKPLSAVISNCKTPSRREKILELLVNSTLSMDVYGGCGKLQLCSRSDKTCNFTEVWQKISATYKFYFAAENSLCTDYITEKFWRTLQVGMVPLVYGGTNYTAVAPPNSFIDVSQFQSFSELMEYLTALDENPNEYAKFFEWRRDYEIKLTDCWHGWCTLCDRTRDNRKNPQKFSVKVYNNLHNWWYSKKVGNQIENLCKEPFAFGEKLK